MDRLLFQHSASGALVCLPMNNLTNAFKGVLAAWRALWQHACQGLHSVGVNMPHVCNTVPLLDEDCFVEALTASLVATGSYGALFLSPYY